MTRTRLPFRAMAVLLLGVLAALAAWLGRGVLRPASVPAPPSAPASAARTAGYPAPQADYPAERLHERVDGAAELLLRTGCRRLLYWRAEQPPADIEVLAFAGLGGARLALERDAGTERTPGGPGDEGWASAQAVFFRRGAAYVRLIADTPAPAGTLLAAARRLDRALGAGEIRP
ncbi:MAG: hypothetical protein HY744_25950 [Deltaproteobacteria bacterium]|nr:hypothetical protein [Deltaproteobacteria bacterium]